MKEKLFLTIAVMALSFTAAAQSVPFLHIPADARTAGMANTGIALDAGAFAVDNNMAAAALGSKNAAFGANYFSWAPSTSSMSLINVGAYYRFGKLAVGLSGRLCNEKPYDIYSGVAKSTGTFQPREMVFGAGLAFRVIEPLSVGATVRYVSSSLYESAQASAVTADITAQFVAGGLRAAVGVANLGSKINYGGADYSLPALAKAGVSYQIAGLTASGEVDYLFAGALMAGIGLEYCIANIAFVRGGFHYGDPVKALPSFASLGAGVQFVGIRLDITWITASKALGNSLGFGLSYSF